MYRYIMVYKTGPGYRVNNNTLPNHLIMTSRHHKSGLNCSLECFSLFGDLF